MVHPGERVQGPVAARLPDDVDENTAAAAARPLPWNPGRIAQPVSHTVAPRHSRSQYPIEPTLSPLPALPALSPLSPLSARLIRYMRPANGSTYRRCRSASLSSLSGPPRCSVISGLLARRSSQKSPSDQGVNRTRSTPDPSIPPH